MTAIHQGAKVVREATDRPASNKAVLIGVAMLMIVLTNAVHLHPAADVVHHPGSVRTLHSGGDNVAVHGPDPWWGSGIHSAAASR